MNSNQNFLPAEEGRGEASLDLVIVTYNRLDKLKKTLQHYEAQTHSFRNLIVVNNCSTDGTMEYLEKWTKNIQTSKFTPILIHANDNIGGSGGFYLGEKKAMELKADWVFVADDDAYADPTMVEKFYQYIEFKDTTHISAVCAEVLNMDGSICLYHREWHTIKNKQYIRTHSTAQDYVKPEFDIDDLSYVGSFLNGKALRKAGLVNPEYFIYFDDSEHSIRLKKYGNIVVVPAIKITHEGGDVTTRKKGRLTWRDYYYKRNSTHMLIKHYPETGLRIVYYKLLDEFFRILHHNQLDETSSLQRKAIFDAILGRLGKDSKYNPGWSVEISTSPE